MFFLNFDDGYSYDGICPAYVAFVLGRLYSLDLPGILPSGVATHWSGEVPSSGDAAGEFLVGTAEGSKMMTLAAIPSLPAFGLG